MGTVAVFGAGGFVGRATVEALGRDGQAAVALPTPRLGSERADLEATRTFDDAEDLPDVWRVRAGGRATANDAVAVVAEVTERLRSAGCDSAVNAAGIADARTRSTPELYGANAAWPLLLAYACREAGVRRLVHVSTAAVQGRVRVLDASETFSPVSPYGDAKALGEGLLRGFAAAGDKIEIVRYRPPSVHGPDRELTRSFAAFTRRLPLVVCNHGDAPVPVALVDNVGAILAALVTAAAPAQVVTHPSEGYTVRSLYEMFAPGRRIRSVPGRPVRAGLRLLEPVGRAVPLVAALARRAELLLIGQGQAPGWLEDQGFVLPFGRVSWESVARAAGRPR